MHDLPAIKTKARKQAYKKPDTVKELEKLADAAARAKYPNAPAGLLAPRKFRDDTSGGLTTAITTYIPLKGGFASRMNNQVHVIRS